MPFHKSQELPAAGLFPKKGEKKAKKRKNVFTISKKDDITIYYSLRG